MKVEIDSHSGFCFGVVNAIRIAEKNLPSGQELYSLGDIVHNDEEIKRLREIGLITISKEQYFTMKNCRVLIRAHGEPPETYEYARKNNIELIDATCPVVLHLQKLVKKTWEDSVETHGQVVIFGRKGHAEIEGLNGHTGNNSIIIESANDLHLIDFEKPVTLYSQTTKSIDEFREIVSLLKEKAGDKVKLTVKDTVCRQVSNRVKHLHEFSRKHDVIVFVSGKKSSNGKFLYSVCKNINPNSYLVANENEVNPEWFKGYESAGVCGATSTPIWLMEKVAATILKHFD